MNNYSNNDSFVYEGKDLKSMSFAQNYHNCIYENIETELGTKIAEIGSGVGILQNFFCETTMLELTHMNHVLKCI
jgi:hypothetical protein